MMNPSNRFRFLLLGVLVLTLSFVFFPQTVFGGELTTPVAPASTAVTFRDIGPPPPPVPPDPTLSLDKETYFPGNIATITLNDINANLDIGAKDFATATVGGSSLTLTETEIDSGIFTGSFTVVSPFPTVEYNSAPGAETTTTDSDTDTTDSKLARLSATLPITTPGNVKISDVIITDNEIANMPLRPVIHAVKIDLTDGATKTASDFTVKLSYANGVFLPLDDVSLLQMYYRETGQGGWKKVTDNFFVDPGSFDFGGNTITSNPSAQAPAVSMGEGDYVLGFPTGLGGGGGGGLVSPGLVVNALAGLTGGSGGGSPQSSLNNLIGSRVIDVPEEVQQMVVNHDSYSTILPMDPDSFEGFDFPLVINDQGFVLGGFTNTLQTSTIKTDTPVTMTFTVYTADKVQHFSLYTNLRDSDDSIPKSDTQILYNDGKDLKIIDPNGLFSDAKITVTDEEDSVKKYITVEMTFAKEMDTSHIITRMWDSKLRSGDLHMLDAIKIVSAEPEFVPIPQETEEVQVEELKSQTIPKWVKNNAEWWVDQQIGDEDFVAGIQYMVNNGIMYIPNTEPVNSSVTKIPDWIKTSTQWWVDNQISDDDFVKAMEWLVTNGVLRIE